MLYMYNNKNQMAWKIVGKLVWYYKSEYIIVLRDGLDNQWGENTTQKHNHHHTEHKAHIM